MNVKYCIKHRFFFNFRLLHCVHARSKAKAGGTTV